MAKKGGKKQEAAPVDSGSESDWDEGSKKPNKKQLEKQQKRQEELDKKAERDALEKQEAAEIKSAKKGGKGAAKGGKKGGKGSLDDALNSFGGSSGSINASGLDNAIDALSLLNKDGTTDKELDRHPERRFKAALTAYTDRRFPEVKAENPGLRKQQIEQLIFKEFQKSDENPMNKMTNIAYNAKDDDIQSTKDKVKKSKQSKYER